MAGFDMQRVIAAFQAGQKIKQDRESKEREAEDRQWELKLRKKQLEMDEIANKKRSRDEAIETAGLLQKTPARRQEVPNAPVPGFPASVIGSIGTPPATVTQQMPHDPITIPGVSGPDVQVQPQTLEEFLRQQRQQQMLGSQLKVQEAGDIEAAKAPYQATQVGRGGKLVIGAGTPQQNIIEGAPPEAPQQPSSVQEYLFYVDQEQKAGRSPASYDAYQAREANRRQPRIAPPQPPSSVQEYNFYRAQEEKAGRKPLSFYEFQQSGANRAGAGTPGQQSPYATERAARTVQSVDELIGKVNQWTTGIGSILARIPQTDARNFQAELDTLKANIAFNELTAMREASKTGGALGQVSNIELNLLQSALGALDTGQSPANIKNQLEKIKGSVQRWTAAATKGGGGPAVGTEEGGYVFQGGDPADQKNWKKK